MVGATIHNWSDEGSKLQAVTNPGGGVIGSFWHLPVMGLIFKK